MTKRAYSSLLNEISSSQGRMMPPRHLQLYRKHPNKLNAFICFYFLVFFYKSWSKIKNIKLNQKIFDLFVCRSNLIIEYSQWNIE